MEHVWGEPAYFGSLLALSGALFGAWWTQGGVRARRSRDALAVLSVLEKTPQDWDERQNLEFTAKFLINRLTLSEKVVARRISASVGLVMFLAAALVLLLLVVGAGHVFGPNLPWQVVVVLLALGAVLGLAIPFKQDAATATLERWVSRMRSR